MNQKEYVEKVQSLKEQIVHLYSINCPKLAEVLKADLAALPEPEYVAKDYSYEAREAARAKYGRKA